MGIGLVMYGAGKRCIGLYKVLTSLGITILLIVDSDNKKWGTKIGSILIESPEKMRAYPNEKVCITVADRSVFVEIKQLLQDKYRYREENIISYNKLIVEAYYNSALIKNLLEAEIQQKSEISILFDCINGLGLGGVEAWTLDLCKALAEDCESYEYIITDSKQYSISNALAKHILSADINHEERFSVDTIECLVKIILGKMPCKVVTSLTNEMLLAAYLVKQKYPNMVGVISVIHNGIEGIYLEHLEFKECIDLFIGVSHDIRRDMIQRGIVPDKIYSMTCPFTCEEILTRTYTENRDSPICIGYAGRIEYEQKRMDLLLKFVELLVNRKVNFKMELAGDGLAKEEMEEFIKEKQMEFTINDGAVFEFSSSFDLDSEDNYVEKRKKCDVQCVNLYRGYIAPCPIMMYVDFFNRYFEKDLPEEKPVKLSEVKDFVTLIELLHRPMEICRYCNQTKQHKWEHITDRSCIKIDKWLA